MNPAVMLASGPRFSWLAPMSTDPVALTALGRVTVPPTPLTGLACRATDPALTAPRLRSPPVAAKFESTRKESDGLSVAPAVMLRLPFGVDADGPTRKLDDGSADISPVDFRISDEPAIDLPAWTMTSGATWVAKLRIATDPAAVTPASTATFRPMRSTAPEPLDTRA